MSVVDVSFGGAERAPLRRDARAELCHDGVDDLPPGTMGFVMTGKID